jgi:hypothetical protein
MNFVALNAVVNKYRHNGAITSISNNKKGVCYMSRRFSVMMYCVLSCFSFASFAAELTSQEVNIPLDSFNLTKKLQLSIGIGSGAFHAPSDPDDVIYTISDRGPNIKCKDSKKLIGKKLCKKGKIFPDPAYSPSIFKLKVDHDQIEVLQRITLKTRHHIPVTGISSPNTEAAFDILGHPIQQDPNGVDSEALVRDRNGDFYVADEYGPSILRLSADGTILERWVPQGNAKNFRNADYKVRENLPAILAKRHLNRGIESIGISPDEDYLYFAMQSPLDNPDSKAYKKSRNVRLFKMDRAKGSVIAEYLYQLDTPDTFRRDNAKKKPAQKDVKVSELAVTGDDQLLVLERISQTTKFYQVHLADEQPIPAKWDQLSQSPTLEQESGEVTPVKKTLVLNTDQFPDVTGKIEGIAYVNPSLWYLVNDDDFSIEGATTHVVTVKD